MEEEQKQKYLKYCPICSKEIKPTPSRPYYVPGYYDDFINDLIEDCDYGHKMQPLNFLCEDYRVIVRISNNPEFLEEMIKLRNRDIIEFELKMSQFRNQVEWQKEKNQPHCPTCGSTNIKKISGLSKAGSVAIWGIFSRKVHKQWHCISCGTEW